MSQTDQDKTEKPTSYRLEEARKRGEVAKSTEAVGNAVMIAFAVVATMSGAWVAAAFAMATRRMIELAGNVPAFDGSFMTWVCHVYAPVAQALTPLLLAVLVAAIAANVLQTGPMFSAHPFKPDFNRMNPAQNLKRLVSPRILWELGKMLVKALLLGVVCWVFVQQAGALAESVAMTMPQRIGSVALASFGKASLYVLLVLGLVAAADLMFMRRDFLRRMRMSRRELREEHKRRDGDPMIKSRQRQQIRELLRKVRALGRVADSDVVLTNPTHVAVALRYEPGRMLAPIVMAKGAGVLSARIRDLAGRHGVPVVQVPPLARALYAECEIDGQVPEALYRELAPVYRELWASRRADRPATAAAP
jgi:flagellar biosynthetic protein FlhB